MTIYQIDENVEFEMVSEPVGVSVSGGADSALLLYFVLKYTKLPVHIFTYAQKDKMFRNSIASISVVNKCADLTDNYNLVHHFIHRKRGIRDDLFGSPIEYNKQGIIHTLYTGITKNPPLDVTEKFMSYNSEHFYRDPNVVRSTRDEFVYMPWTNLDKQDLARLYRLHNLTETLLPITRSCEWTPGDPLIPDPGMEHCGKCWWCEERLWGFGRL